MEFSLTIQTDNAAFGDGDDAEMCAELARILREVAARLEAGEDTGRVRDYNGNTVGRYSIET
jgi:hypothetical protein